MTDLADKIVELRLATRRACMCEEGGGQKKSTLSLKTKVLFLIRDGASPKEIITRLVIAKTNLAILTRELADDGLIEKQRGERDRREISYRLTEAGEARLNSRLQLIEAAFQHILTDKKDYADALKSIDVVLDLLSYLAY